MIELKQRHGEKLETMATEQVREQLLARGVTDADLKGPCGGSKRVGTLRKMLLACADVVEMDEDEPELTPEGGVAGGVACLCGK